LRVTSDSRAIEWCAISRACIEPRRDVAGQIGALGVSRAGRTDGCETGRLERGASSPSLPIADSVVLPRSSPEARPILSGSQAPEIGFWGGDEPKSGLCDSLPPRISVGTEGSRVYSQGHAHGDRRHV
jgi:hypothetical protein